MKKNLPLFLVLLLLTCLSCQDKKITVDQAFSVAKNYLASRFDKKKILENKSFVMFTTPDSIAYILKKANVIIGDLNNDKAQDVIISYIIVSKDNSSTTRHVIFINDKGVFKPQKEIKMELQITKIADGFVFAEKSKMASDSPNFGCKACIEKIKFRFDKDSLIQILSF